MKMRQIALMPKLRLKDTIKSPPKVERPKKGKYSYRRIKDVQNYIDC